MNLTSRASSSPRSAAPGGAGVRAHRAACGAWAAALIAAAGVPASLAAEYSVSPGGLGDFPTIQTAVDAALPGDVVVLEDGRFVGDGNRDVTFRGKDLVVRSRNGAAACTLDTQGTVATPHRAFRLDDGESAAARIDGFTIVNGYTTGPFPEVGGAGILITTNTSPTITNCIFDGNESGFQGFGAGILAYDGCDVTITDCVFRNGYSGWYGGGFTLRLNSDGIVERCLVIDNVGFHAGGGASITNSDALVTDCLFVNNSSPEAGGGGVMVKAGAVPVFTRCAFIGNETWSGAGLGLGTSAHVTCRDCLFEGNRAQVSAGGIGLGNDPSTLLLENCTIVNNRAGGSGSQIMVNTSAQLTMRNSIVRGACSPAPVYLVMGSTFDVDCSLLQGGAASIYGPGNVIYGSSNADLDPRFCGPKSCELPAYPAGDWTLHGDSPAAPPNSACGLLGAFPVACGTTSAGHALDPSSWAAIKARYLGSGAE